jgi:plastocyanin
VSSFRGAPRRLAAAANYTVGVDNATPQGHNFQYTDFFPNNLKIPDTSGVNPAITIDFAWNPGSQDGFHTVTMFQPGHSPANYPLTVTPGVSPGIPADGAGAPLELNPKVTNPFPLPACAAGACPYNGTADISSGAAPTVVGAHFVVTISGVAAGTVINYACLIHPARMHGTITVVAAGADTAQTAAAAAAAQLNTSTSQALAAETAANKVTGTKNADGTTTWQAVAGTATTPAQNPVEVLEMLPPNIPVTPGDTINWTTTTQQGNEIHTVTFPDMATISDPATIAALSATEPLPSLCEAAVGAPDTRSPGGPPPNFGCASPALVENGLVPQPFGTTTITSGNTVGSSGLISTAGGPFPNHFSYTFAKNGTFSFMCHIHPHMFGTVFTAGYHNLASDGGIFTHGHTDFLGSMGAIPLNKPVVGGQGTPDQQGYYEVASDGGIFTFGDAKFRGSMGDKPLNKPVVGMGVTPDGGGYYEVASDGGIFTFGDAQFMGSMGDKALNKPVVGMAVTPDGGGYYEVASDGGIFTFGDASFHGSEGGVTLNQPVVGMAATNDGAGYYMVASDGGIFTHGSAVFLGSEGGLVLNKPVVGMQLTTTGDGYRLVASDGGIFTHGDALFFGSEGGISLNQPVVGMFGS